MSEPLHVSAKLRVIYGDTDQMGVVYYANYLRYFELSRSEYFRACGGNYVEIEKQGFGLPVVQAHCDYRAPARYDDVLLVDVHVAQLRRASLRFEYTVRREADGLTLATGHTVHACIGRSGRPVGLPTSITALLRPGGEDA